MKKSVYFFISIAFFGIFLFYACSHEVDDFAANDEQLRAVIAKSATTGNINEYLLPDGKNLAEIPNQDKKNLLNPDKIALGKMLFYEPGIGLVGKNKALSQTYSCSSCHIPDKGFTPGRFQGIADGAIGFGIRGESRFKSPLYDGDDVDAQGARPLTMHNLAYVTNALWSGSFGTFDTNVGTESAWRQDTLTEINFLGLEGLEANNIRALQVHRQLMNRAIADTLRYKPLFDKAFPEIQESERYTLTTTAFAIAAYFRSILTNEAPFQRWLRGDRNAMTQQQKDGALVFFGKAECTNCHQGPALNQMTYQAVGVKNLYQNGYLVFRTGVSDKRNLGRGGFTGRAEDMHKFKVPQLYNLKNIGFYFHGASKTTLEDVVEYFDKGEAENKDVPKSQLSSAFHPLNLTTKEKADLVEFLKNGLFDPNINRFVPQHVMSGKCFPNNDYISKLDMKCN
jgi:cytochrome c peroxidase